MPPRSIRPGTAFAACALLAIGLSACGNTLQLRPLANHTLQPLVTVNRFPIYWVGGTFQKLPITSVGHDYGGAYTLQYGTCEIGGGSTCVTPLEIVTSQDNSFEPGASATQTIDLRGIKARVTQSGRTIEIPAGEVLVDIYARTPSLARAAAATIVPINRLGVPGASLPSANASNGYGSEPLPGQLPRSLRITRGRLHQSGSH